LDSKLKEILEWAYCIIIAIVLAMLFRYYIGTPTIVKQISMYPTLVQDQRLWLNRLGRTTKTLPERGQIITFEAPSKKYFTEDEIDMSNPVAKYENEPTNIFSKFMYYVVEAGKDSYIKRVIALPGEHVEIKDGSVYINGEKLDEPYLQDGIVTDVSGVGFDDFVVPENCVFAMGDNRTHSTDCRSFGCIPLEKIESTVAIRIWPLSEWGKVD
jgi:signal peptidase I